MVERPETGMRNRKNQKMPREEKGARWRRRRASRRRPPRRRRARMEGNHA